MENDPLNLLDDSANLEIVKEVLQAIENVRYGSVEITIHESRVVQIERKEKIRFDKNNREARKNGLSKAE